MPPMNATGMNTATIVNVVAITARPISAVPSRAASKWSLPRWRWRTMFSRTTIASSMSIPMASESPISVSTFRREAERLHGDEGGDDGDGQGEAGDDGGAPRVQEQEHDEHGQDAADDHRGVHVVDGVADERGVVAHDLQDTPGGRSLPICSTASAHAVRHRHRVGARTASARRGRARSCSSRMAGVARLLDARPITWARSRT